MTYLDEVASEIARQAPQQSLAPEDTGLLFRLYALLALARGADVNAADVHNAWAVWMQERNPEHPQLRPFNQLDPATQDKDEPYVRAIRAVARTR